MNIKNRAVNLWELFRGEMMALSYSDEFCDAYWADEIWEIIDKYEELMRQIEKEDSDES